jgi:pilus assembly protein Flp/PilA
METLNKVLLAFWQEESGLTIIEYALAGTLVSIAAVTALTALGTKVSTKIGNITAGL